MSKRTKREIKEREQKVKNAEREAFNMKDFFVKYAKRYGIVLLISAPIIMVLNYIMAHNIDGYKGPVVFFVTFAMLLFACLIGLVIFTKKDDKQKREATKEKLRDPFAD